MQYCNYKPEWLDVLRTQDALLTLEALHADGAFALGSIMLRLAREKYRKSASFRIITGGQTTFSFLMDGTDLHNEWWMDKKLNVCRETGVSSMRSLLEIALGVREMPEAFENENNYALCGGCMPLRTSEGKLPGYVLCSGMHHEEDHQLLADALAEYLGVDIPSLLS